MSQRLILSHSKSPDTVTRFSMEIATFLRERGAKLIVVACNSASAMALQTLRVHLDVPVVGVVEPGAQAAGNVTGGRIGVIGTAATIASRAYRDALAAVVPRVEVREQPTPLLVHLVEEGWTTGDVPESVARHYLTPLLDAEIDTLILGCTHYPLLADTVRGVVGPGVRLVDSARETARVVADLVATEGLAANGGEGSLVCYTSDSVTQFTELGRRFFGDAPRRVIGVDQSETPWRERQEAS